MSLRLQDLRALPHISVSAINCLLRCPRQYRYRYLDKLTPAFRPVAFAFGSAWHRTIGHLLETHRDGHEQPNGELHDHLRDGIVHEIHADGVPVLFDDQEDEGVLIDKAVQMLDVFLAEVPLPDEVIDVERAFSIELYDLDTGEALDVPLIGAIDAVVVEGGKTVLWELKTGKRRWSEDQLAYDLQPTAYLLAARHLGFEEPAMKLVLTTKAKKPAVQIEPITRTPADEDDVAATAASVLRAVAAGVDHPIRGWQCKGCPYIGACS